MGGGGPKYFFSGPKRPPRNGKTHVLATVADGQTTASLGEGKKIAKAQPELASGCVLIGWALGRSLDLPLFHKGFQVRPEGRNRRGETRLRGPEVLGPLSPEAPAILLLRSDPIFRSDLIFTLAGKCENKIGSKNKVGS